MFERKDLLKEYEAAIENDLPFEETKKIYLRLKEIKKLLENPTRAVQVYDKMNFQV